jgi:hypothetical protein
MVFIFVICKYFVNKSCDDPNWQWIEYMKKDGRYP